MADDEEKSKEGADEPKKKKSKLILIIIPVVVIILGGGGFFAYKTFLAPAGGDEESQAETHGQQAKHTKKGEHGKKSKHGEAEQGEGPTFFSLAPFVVNLQDNIGTRYLKLTLKLELEGPETEQEIKALLPKVRDALIILLSSKNYAEIGTVEGKYRLRDEIVKRVNRFLEDEPVQGVYFTDFVIQ